MHSIDAQIAVDRMKELSSAITAYRTNKSMSVWHGDGSFFMFACCYYEIINDNHGNPEWLIVIPEHMEPQWFSMSEISFSVHPNYPKSENPILHYHPEDYEEATDRSFKK